MPRFFVPLDLSAHAGAELDLPPGPARHVQVRRLQPGQALRLFDGRGGQWQARIAHMGRQDVRVQVLAHEAVEREAAVPVWLAVGLMASERMDWLLEKATELGAHGLSPVVTARSQLRLSGERAAKKHSQWQAAVIAASEQCGRNQVMQVQAPRPWAEWLGEAPAQASVRWVLSLQADAQPLAARVSSLSPGQPLCLLSGPEGGLDAAEEQAARQAGFVPISLGPRILRAETAPLAALAALAALSAQVF